MKKRSWLLWMMIIVLLATAACSNTDAAGDQAVIEQWEEQAGEESQPLQEPPAEQKDPQEPAEQQEPSKEEPKDPQPKEKDRNETDYRIDPKLGSVISQIEADFAKMKGVEDPEVHRVSHYYGTFHGAVPIQFRGRRANWRGDDLELAGAEIRYDPSEEIILWKEGKFYTLEDAYGQGILTKEQIAAIAERQNDKTCLKMDELEGSLRKPLDALLEQIVTDHQKKYNYAQKGTVATYYGIYSGFAVVAFDQPEQEIEVWADGDFISLTKAFEEKLLTQKQMDRIEEIHNVESLRSLPVEKWPLQRLLQRIGWDYDAQISEECNASVSEYYGIYKGAVPVMIGASGMAYGQAMTEETVAGYTFGYNTTNQINVWKDGAFYDLQEAYDAGILTEHDIADMHRRTTHIDLGWPADAEEMVQAYAQANGLEIPKNPRDMIGKYIGRIGGCHLQIFAQQPDGNAHTAEIAGVTFRYQNSNEILAYKDGKLYTLQQAYAQKLLTKKQLAVVASINEQ